MPLAWLDMPALVPSRPMRIASDDLSAELLSGVFNVFVQGAHMAWLPTHSRNAASSHLISNRFTCERSADSPDRLLRRFWTSSNLGIRAGTASET